MCSFHLSWWDRSWTLDKSELFSIVWGASVKWKSCGSGWILAGLVFIDFWSYALWVQTCFYRDYKNPHSLVKEHMRDVRGKRSYWFPHIVFCCLNATALVQVLIISSLDHSKSLSNCSPVLSTIPASFLQTAAGFSHTHECHSPK